MRASVSLNGDGDGEGNYMSIYIIIMRGKYDALLPWPFNQNVSDFNNYFNVFRFEIPQIAFSSLFATSPNSLILYVLQLWSCFRNTGIAFISERASSMKKISVTFEMK